MASGNPFEKADIDHHQGLDAWKGPYLEPRWPSRTYLEVNPQATDLDVARVVVMLHNSGNCPLSACLALGLSYESLDRWMKSVPKRVWTKVGAARRIANEKRRAEQKRYMTANPVARLRASVHAHVWHCLKKRKSGSVFDMLPYSLDDLVAHLEAQMLPGMTWANYGRVWQVDHKRPVSWFDWNAVDAQATLRECWALSNLQPLWASDNRKKGNRYEHT